MSDFSDDARAEYEASLAPPEDPPIAIGTHATIDRAEYDALPHLNYSLAKALEESPAEFQHKKRFPGDDSTSKKLGRVGHLALVEPDKFKTDVVQWTAKTEGGEAKPRKGKEWEAFKAANVGKEIVLPDEYRRACLMREAVMARKEAREAIEGAQSEVTAIGQLMGIDCKARLDALGRFLAEIKTTRHARRERIQNDGARLLYHAQFAWYSDILESATGEARPLRVIAVQSDGPFCVAVFDVHEEELAEGRRLYQGWLRTYLECMESGRWPEPTSGVLRWELPVWAPRGLEEEAEDAAA